MLYEDNTAKLLGLEDVIVKKVWEEGAEKHIEIELSRRTECRVSRTYLPSG